MNVFDGFGETMALLKEGLVSKKYVMEEILGLNVAEIESILMYGPQPEFEELFEQWQKNEL